jgi:ELWxxDGT repeat protein
MHDIAISPIPPAMSASRSRLAPGLVPLLALALLLPAAPVAAQAALVADLSPGFLDFSPRHFAVYDGQLYFGPTPGGHRPGEAAPGAEAGGTVGLWAYDAATDEARLVAPFAEEPRYLTVYDGKLFFSAGATSFVTELWVYDAATGAVSPVGSPDYPASLTVYDGRLFFAAHDAAHGMELWVYDAATGAVTLAADIWPGPSSSSPSWLGGRPAVYDGRLFFSADDGIRGHELWAYDAATGTATLAAEIYLGPTSSAPAWPVVYDDRLFFSADDGVRGRELWAYDAATGAAGFVANVNPGDRDADPGSYDGFAVYDGRLFFNADNRTYGEELWVYDAATDAVTLVADLYEGRTASAPWNATVYDGRLHFFATDDVQGHKLWAYDAATGTVALAADARTCSVIPRHLAVYDGGLYFCGVDTVHGEELWRYRTPSALALVLAPVDPPVVLGPGGGTFRFRVTVTNLSATAQPFDGWTEAVLPGGSVFGPLFGPVPRTLAAGETLGPVTLEQAVPASAPPGEYRYRANVGTFPGPVAATAEFTVEKTAGDALAGSGAGEGWRVEAVEGPEASSAAPGGLALHGASPNPFEGRTAVRFAVPEAARVSVDVLDVLGRRVAVLHEGPVEAGAHAVPWAADGLPGGVYVVRLRAGGTTATRRVTLLR